MAVLGVGLQRAIDPGERLAGFVLGEAIGGEDQVGFGDLGIAVDEF